jgi:putative beta-lysine N-acetyltransferase
MTPDIIETMGASVIQHGTENDRIYLMKLARDDAAGMTKRLDALAEKNRYTKIFAKVPAFAKERFLAASYRVEAHVPCFFNGADDCFFMGKYFSSTRKQEKKQQREDILALAEKAGKTKTTLADGYTWRIMNERDADAMATFYRHIFESYPFPIYDADYITKTMRENVIYFGVEYRGELVALTSSEMDADAENVEMTDFATEGAHRGKGLAAFLLATMENEMKQRGIKTAYTIGRALSLSVAIIFIRAGYSFGGVLTNNTYIDGHFESMNVWYKSL